VGTPKDLERRTNLRVDDRRRQRKIEKARNIIYIQGKSITSKKVEDLLAEESLVPTRACTDHQITWGNANVLYHLECFLIQARTVWVQVVPRLCRGSTP
jgi:hypothetical protein